MNKRLFSITIMCLILPMTAISGCAVNKAMNQPDKKDVSVLNKGTPRYEVIGALGKPVDSETTKNGRIIDVFSFIQGYSKGAKAARAFGHGVMDIATLGLWEVVGSPIEAVEDGEKVVVRVRYDKNKTVESVTALKGKNELNK